MEISYIIQNAILISIGIIMLGIGLKLKIEDFKRVAQSPKPIIIGLFVQSVVLPLVCFFIAKNSGLSSELALGLMLLSASPGGVTANLFSHLFKGNVALNISLTAINSVLVVVSMPIIVNLSLNYFMAEDQVMQMNFKKVVEVISIVIIPVLIGVYLNQTKPDFSKKYEKLVKIFSTLVLVLLMLMIVIKEKQAIIDNFAEVGMSTFIFCAASILIGYFSGKFFKLNDAQSRALAFEIGIHNSAMAVYLALNVLKNETMAIPIAIYSIWMYPLAFLFGFIINKTSQIVEEETK